MPIPIGRAGFGLAIAGAVVYDPGKQTGNGFIVNVPVTFEFRKELRINFNFGTQYYTGGDPHGLYATTGAGVSWNFVHTGASFPRCSPSWVRGKPTRASKAGFGRAPRKMSTAT